MTGAAPQASMEDFSKAFDAKLLEHLTIGLQMNSSDSDGDGSSGGPPGKSSDLNIHQWPDETLYFKGYPECDFLRQVSADQVIRRIFTFRIDANLNLSNFLDQYRDARLEQRRVLPCQLCANARLYG